MNIEDMKKIYTTPSFDVVSFNCNNIVTASDSDSDSLEMKGEWNNNSASAKQRNNIWDED